MRSPSNLGKARAMALLTPQGVKEVFQFQVKIWVRDIDSNGYSGEGEVCQQGWHLVALLTSQHTTSQGTMDACGWNSRVTSSESGAWMLEDGIPEVRGCFGLIGNSRVWTSSPGMLEKQPIMDGGGGYSTCRLVPWSPAAL